MGGDPEGAAVGVELWGDTKAHFVAKPWGDALEILKMGRRQITELTFGWDFRVAFHFDDEDGEFVGSCYARTVWREYMEG